MSHLFSEQKDPPNRSRCTTFSYDDSSDDDEGAASPQRKVKSSTESSTQSLTAPARTTMEQYYPSERDRSGLDKESPSDVSSIKGGDSDLCCGTFTGREIRKFSKSCLYLIIVLLCLFIGGVILQVVVRSNKEGPDEFFNEPWVWPESNITVGAYYYPWYYDDFHRGSGYLREQLSTTQEPVLGEYDDTDPTVIYQHIKWSVQANIGLWVTSWWGPGTREDTTTKNVILEHPALGDLKIALFYETTGRIKEDEEYSSQRVVPDIEYMAQNYFKHPNYLRINDRPVLFVYLTRKLEGLGMLDQIVEEMRMAARNEGYNLYLVGDHVFHHAPDEDETYPPFTILDAVTNYDVYGSLLRPSPYATEAGLQEHFQRAQKWQARAGQENCAFIPSVSPGYNDLGVRPEKRNGPLSRELMDGDSPGSLFRTALQYGRTLVDPTIGNLIMVNSFNEWHEDTQIEPCRGESTSLPEIVTHGIEYHGYGELYLDILREETTQF